MRLADVFERRPATDGARPMLDRPARAPHAPRLQVVIWLVLGVGAAALAVVTASDLAAALAVSLAIALLVGLWFLGHARDGVAMLSFFLVTIACVPAPYAIAGLRSIGAPSLLFAAALGLWWIVERAWPAEPRRRRIGPIHVLLVVLATVWLVSYAVAALRAQDPAGTRAMDRSLLVLLGLVGIALTGADGTSSRARLETLVRRVVIAGTYIAVVGILQSRDVVDLARFNIPGLVIQRGGESTYDVRSGFDRISSVTLHPIEFAAVLGMVFPLALHLLIHARSKSDRRLMIACTVLIGVAMPMAVTRTGVLGFAIGLAVLIPSWPKHLRVKFYMYGLPAVVALRILIPGLLGTLKSLFTSAGQDPSVEGRTDDLPIVFDLIARRPFFGLGPGLFPPAKYFYLDNQLLGTALELGAIGLAAMLALVIGAAVTADATARRAPTSRDRLLGRALAASVLAGFATFFTFDALSFPVFTGLLFIVFGIIGALHRIVFHEAAEAVPVERHSVTVRRRPRTMPVHVG